MVLCHERILREFRADSPLRNCFSKKKSIASELPFSKKKSTYANGEIVCVCLERVPTSKTTVRIRVKHKRVNNLSASESF